MNGWGPATTARRRAHRARCGAAITRLESPMSGHLIDDSIDLFHKKLALYSSGGPFIDRYALTIVGVALPTLEPALSPTSTEIGLIGAASLVGVFVGGMFFGLFTDRIGREFMYIADMLRSRSFRFCRHSPVRPGSLSSFASCSAWRSVPTTRSPPCCWPSTHQRRTAASCWARSVGSETRCCDGSSPAPSTKPWLTPSISFAPSSASRH